MDPDELIRLQKEDRNKLIKYYSRMKDVYGYAKKYKRRLYEGMPHNTAFDNIAPYLYSSRDPTSDAKKTKPLEWIRTIDHVYHRAREQKIMERRKKQRTLDQIIKEHEIKFLEMWDKRVRHGETSNQQTNNQGTANLHTEDLSAIDKELSTLSLILAFGVENFCGRQIKFKVAYNRFSEFVYFYVDKGRTVNELIEIILDTLWLPQFDADRYRILRQTWEPDPVKVVVDLDRTLSSLVRVPHLFLFERIIAEVEPASIGKLSSNPQRKKIEMPLYKVNLNHKLQENDLEHEQEVDALQRGLA